MRLGRRTIALAIVTMTVDASATAQQAAAPIATAAHAASGSPFAPPEESTVAAVTMPELGSQPDAADSQNFDKYYAFHRADTDFATARADIVECDGYARGLRSRIGYTQTPYPYAGTVAGAVGGALGNAMAAAIFGSAEKRRMRRVNMRRCMNFKGYDRYGLSKDVWEKFNFEEGLSGVDEEKRQAYLRQQAMVASSGAFSSKVLGL